MSENEHEGDERKRRIAIGIMGYCCAINVKGCQM